MTTLIKKRNIFIGVCLTIPVLLLAAFVLVPVLDLFRMSFTNWDGFSATSQYIGFDNYVNMFNNSDLWLSLRNNAIYFILHLVCIPLELMMAVMLTSKLRAAKFYKTMVFLPYIINGVAIAYTFSYFFSPINGAFDAILNLLGMSNVTKNWLSDPKIVNFVLAFVSLWRFSGYHIILFIAALQSVPKDMIEASVIDGANSWQMFRFVQIPSIMLVVDFILFDNIRGALQVFDIPFVMTSGGPGYASSTFTLYTIKTAFTFNNFGLAATMAVAIMLMIIIFQLIQNTIVHHAGKRKVRGGSKKGGAK